MLNIDELLKDVKSVAITGHVRPDGDCAGSTLGLYNYIKENMPEIEADIYLEDIPEEFKFLVNSDKLLQTQDESKVYDIFFVLDCSSLDRIASFTQEYFERARKTVCIDHHRGGSDFADESFVNSDTSSCSELLFETMDKNKISKAVAECLYLGIIHDTGVFKYQAVTARTMEVAGFLMGKGIDFTSMIDNTFYSRTYKQTQALGKALLESIRFFDGKAIFSLFTKKDMGFYEVTPKDLSGVAEQLRLVDGVEVAIFIYELEHGEYKVSMRSKNYVDVNKIAKIFNGGGHIRAAGFSMLGEPRDIINNIGAQLELQL